MDVTGSLVITVKYYFIILFDVVVIVITVNAKTFIILTAVIVGLVVMFKA